MVWLEGVRQYDRATVRQGATEWESGRECVSARELVLVWMEAALQPQHSTSWSWPDLQLLPEPGRLHQTWPATSGISGGLVTLSPDREEC